MIWTHFLLQVNLYLILFFILYKILLAKETHFTLNRVYLISAASLSMLLPFLRFEWIRENRVAQSVYGSIDQLSELVVIPEPVAQTTSFNWGLWIIGAYIVGILYFTMRFFFRLFLVRKSLKTTIPGAAFSFFNKKVIAEDVPSLNIIDYHEETHINQKHSWDVIFFEILNIFLWFNPVIYGYKIAIKNIHEYLADEAAASYQGCKESYAMLILSQAFKTDVNQLTNKFFTQSQVKKRIYMLYKDRSTKRAIWKYGLVVPIFALALLLSASTIQKNQQLIDVANKLDIPIFEAEIEPTPELSHVIKPSRINELAQVATAEQDTSQAYNYLPAEEVNTNTPSSTSQLLDVTIEYNTTKLPQVTIQLPTTLQTGTSPSGTSPSGTMPTTVMPTAAPLAVTFKATPLSSVASKKQQELKAENKVNTVPEALHLDVPPSYPGGMERFYDFMGNSIRYPNAATESNKQGTVFISFIVEENGTISNVNAIGKKLGYGLEEEAMRVIKRSKVWTPGLLAGKPTRSRYQVPIRFTLPTENFAVTLPEVKTRGNIGFVLRNMIAGTQISGIEDAMYIIDGNKADYNGYNILDPKRIEKISYLNPNDARNQYGSAYSKGAIVIELTPEF